jgi:Tfp pilus assembly protein PilV
MSRRFGRRRAQRGVSLVETVTATVIFTAVIAGTAALTSVVFRTNTRAMVEAPMANASRSSLDELNFQLRGGTAVVPSFTANSLTYSSTTTSVALKSQAFNTTLANPIISGVFDYVGFTYDSTAHQLTETILPGTGGTRPARNSFVIAKNVSAVTFSYLARNQFTAASSSSTVFSLSALPIATPTVYINGAQTSNFSWSAGSQQVTVNGLVSGSDVQVVYTVSPTASSGVALNAVTQVTARLDLQKTDGMNITRTFTLEAGARLRNQRI